MKRGCVGSCRGRSGFLSRAGASSVGRRRSCLGACRSSGSWWCPVFSQGVSWPCAAPSCRQTPFGAVCRPTGARVTASPPSRPCRPSPVWGGCAVCSRPDLINERASEPGSELQHLLQLYPAGGHSTKRVRPELSGKVSVLDYLLALVKTQTSDKLVVLVSSYTRTLGLFGTLCQTRGYCLVRLDGCIFV